MIGMFVRNVLIELLKMTRVENVREAVCKCCGKTFLKRIKKRQPRVITIRSKWAVTCSSKCSKEYNHNC